MSMFKDRIDAGIQLAKKLIDINYNNIVVLAIPRGGLPIAAVISRALDAPMDVVLTKKIGHPFNKELAIGAVNLDTYNLSASNPLPENYLQNEIERLRAMLKEEHNNYYRKRYPQYLKDKTIIIVDDGIATGNTVISTVMLVNAQKPKRIIIATPVSSHEVISKIESMPEISHVVCLHKSSDFNTVSEFYDNFDQITDTDAIKILEENTYITLNGQKRGI